MPIDAAYCINLIERNDRRDSANAIFNKYHLPVQFYSVEKDPLGGKRGCFISHLSLIQKCYQAGMNHVLIFEDDITSSLDIDTFNKNFDSVIKFIENIPYDIFFLGSTPEIIMNKVTHIVDDIYKVNALCAHAYIISRSGMEKYKDLQYQNIAIDFVYLYCNHSYAIYPSIFYQNDSSSDIAPKIIEKFGIRNSMIQTREKYATCVNIPIIRYVWLLIIAMIIIFIITKKTLFIVIPIIILISYVLIYDYFH
jgi:GR25 family glycosyltransferase involved in LPS biosynthesis